MRHAPFRKPKRVRAGGARIGPDPPHLFDEELHGLLEAIKAAPYYGNLYSVQPGREHRRVLMPATRFHVYYRLAEPNFIRVVAIWSAIRGRGPRL